MYVTEKAEKPSGRCDSHKRDADQLLLENVQNVLAQSVYPQLREIRCECDDGAVTLQGRVPTYFLKQVAQQLIRPIPHLARIHNLLEVGGGMPNSAKQ